MADAIRLGGVGPARDAGPGGDVWTVVLRGGHVLSYRSPGTATHMCVSRKCSGDLGAIAPGW
jgi:hypothetical protein